MKIELKQEKLKWNFNYEARTDSGENIRAEAKRTIIPTVRSVNIWNENNEVLTQLKENRILRKVLTKIPYLNILLSLIIRKKDKYDIYRCDEKKGSLEWYLSFKRNVVYVEYEKKRYEVYNKAKGKLNRFYVFEDQKQIGIIDKDYITKWNADRYVGEFNNDTDQLLNIIIMLFIDLSMYTKDTSNRLESSSREYTLWQFSNKKLNVSLDDEWKADEPNKSECKI